MYLKGLKNSKANTHGVPVPLDYETENYHALESASVPLCNLFFLFPLRTLLSGIHPVLLFKHYFLAQLCLMEILLSKSRALIGSLQWVHNVPLWALLHMWHSPTDCRFLSSFPSGMYPGQCCNRSQHLHWSLMNRRGCVL